jgi:peroxiredoxin 2/4
MKTYLHMPEVTNLKIGQPAPGFSVESHLGPVSLSDYRGRWLVLFSYPADFTPVCTSEIIAFARIQSRLQALNCELIGVSVDSVYNHLNWLKTIEEKTGIAIRFPILADLNLEVSGKYGLLPNANAEEASRSLYVIDARGIIRAIMHYPATTGRNTAEVIRLLTALQNADAHKAITPANWQSGDELIYTDTYRTR